MKTIQRNFFLYTAIGCGLFVLLTLLAMLVYPGGNHADLAQPGYSFTHNFFSDLGLRQAHNGQPNPWAGGLFFAALSLSGLTLALFFVQFRRFFLNTRRGQLLSLGGALLGMGAGICFTGVAFTPADVHLEAHVFFVMWAFRLFPLAVLCYTLAMFSEASFPRPYAYVFVVFFGLLVGYYLLLTQGPGFDTPGGQVIQVVGQKAIVYASIVAVMVQSLGAWRREVAADGG
jgi:hypothetical membrane protein